MWARFVECFELDNVKRVKNFHPRLGIADPCSLYRLTLTSLSPYLPVVNLAFHLLLSLALTRLTYRYRGQRHAPPLSIYPFLRTGPPCHPLLACGIIFESWTVSISQPRPARRARIATLKVDCGLKGCSGKLKNHQGDGQPGTLRRHCPSCWSLALSSAASLFRAFASLGGHGNDHRVS